MPDIKLPKRAEPGVVIGGYELVRQIGRGGMADVWVARKVLRQQRKIVAIKLIADHFVGDERYARMFRAEAELAAGLSHANIVQVFDEGEEDGRSFLVMEWVDGLNLLKLGDMLALLGDDQRRFRVISYVIGQLLYALDYAHSITTHDGSPMGVVHRDVSPQNVLVSNNGEVKLTDFGVACHNSERSSGMHVKGKVRYMAPEQLSGKTRAPTVDLYAVGAILHELVDGRKFRGDHEDGQDLLSVVLSGQVPALTRPIPPELDALRLGLLQADPQRRIPSAEHALTMLRRYPGYGDARDELTKLCRHLTGIARPRREPGQSSKMLAADQATTRWGGRQAPALPRVGAGPVVPPPPPRAKPGAPPLRTSSTTAVKNGAPATGAGALITGHTMVMQTLPLLHGNAAVAAPSVPLAPTMPLCGHHLRMAPTSGAPAATPVPVEAAGTGAVHGWAEASTGFGPQPLATPFWGGASSESSGTSPTETESIDPSMILAVEPNGRVETNVRVEPHGYVEPEASYGRGRDGSDERPTFSPGAPVGRGDSVSIVLPRGMAVALVIVGLVLIAVMSVITTWMVVKSRQATGSQSVAIMPMSGAAAGRTDGGDGASAEAPEREGGGTPGATVELTPLTPEPKAMAMDAPTEARMPEPTPVPTTATPAMPVDAPPIVPTADAAAEPEEHAEPPAPGSTSRPRAKPTGTAWVKLRSSTELKKGQLKIGSRTFDLDDSTERKIAAATGASLKWRKDPSDSWHRASAATFKAGRHYIIHVAKDGPRVRTEG